MFFSLSFYKANLLKEIITVLVWLGPSNPLGIPLPGIFMSSTHKTALTYIAFFFLNSEYAIKKS